MQGPRLPAQTKLGSARRPAPAKGQGPSAPQRDSACCHERDTPRPCSPPQGAQESRTGPSLPPVDSGIRVRTVHQSHRGWNPDRGAARFRPSRRRLRSQASAHLTERGFPSIGRTIPPVEDGLGGRTGLAEPGVGFNSAHVNRNPRLAGRIAHGDKNSRVTRGHARGNSRVYLKRSRHQPGSGTRIVNFGSQTADPYRDG